MDEVSIAIQADIKVLATKQVHPNGTRCPAVLTHNEIEIREAMIHSALEKLQRKLETVINFRRRRNDTPSIGANQQRATRSDTQPRTVPNQGSRTTE